MPHAPSTRLFVAKLPPCVREEEFRSHFAACGPLVDAYMPRERTQQHYRSIGFVTYASIEDALRVVNTPHRFKGHRVIVDFATPKGGKWAKDGPQSGGCFIGKGAHGGTTCREMDIVKQMVITERKENERFSCPEVASSICDLESIKKHKREASCINLDQSLLRTKQSSLITSDIWSLSHDPGQEASFDCIGSSAQSDINSEDDKGVLESLLREMDRHTGCSSVLHAGYNADSTRPGSSGSAASSVPTQDTSSSSDWAADQRTKPRVYVGRLHEGVKKSDLGQYFKQFGEVTDVYIPRSRECPSKHRGFGFVSFASKETIKALIAHGSHKLKGLPIILDLPIEEEYCSKDMGHAPHSK